jgi:hypothetical protein
MVMRIGDDDLSERVVETYLRAKSVVIGCGYAPEVDWQYGRTFDSVDGPSFLAEFAWVVLAAGLSDHVVRKSYPRVAAAFCEWDIGAIAQKSIDMASSEAYSHFSHRGKIDAICNAVREVAKGFDKIADGIRTEGVSYLRRFPYIGPVTAYHLAKNLGVDVCKPDRHLTRFAAALGFDDVESLCSLIAARTDERISVVDIVLWRFLTICRRYELVQ